MRVSNEKRWLETKSLYERQDPERGQEITKFAESLANFVEHHLTVLDRDVNATEFRALIEGGMREIDPDHLTPEEMTEGLVVLTQVWEFAEELWESFTYFELAHVTTNIAEKIAESSKEASERI